MFTEDLTRRSLRSRITAARASSAFFGNTSWGARSAACAFVILKSVINYNDLRLQEEPHTNIDLRKQSDSTDRCRY